MYVVCRGSVNQYQDTNNFSENKKKYEMNTSKTNSNSTYHHSSPPCNVHWYLLSTQQPEKIAIGRVISTSSKLIF